LTGLFSCATVHRMNEEEQAAFDAGYDKGRDEGYAEGKKDALKEAAEKLEGINWLREIS